MKRIHVINNSNYTRIDPSKLITQYGKYITNGNDNSYFYEIEDLYLSSPTTNAIIDAYVNYIIGDGLISNIGSLDDIITEEDVLKFTTDFKIHGNASLQIIYNHNHEVVNLYHIPVRNLAVNKESDILNDITGYWYSFDWNNKYKYKPVFIPSFGYGENNETEVFYISRPSPQPLYALPDWQSGVQYAQVEQELANFHIKHIQNSFSVGSIININQGSTDSVEAMEEAENKIKNKLTGTNGERVIVSFNDNYENRTTVDNIEIADAHQKFEFVANEARDKIMLSHKVNDPSLFGFPNSTGFSSDADKMEQALKILYRNQINPLRKSITNALKKILYLNDITDIRFKDFDELDVDNNDNIDKELNLSNLSEKKMLEILSPLGEVVDLDQWELIKSEVVDHDNDLDDETIMMELNLADTGRAIPNAKSEQDIDGIYKIRYRYSGSKNPQRTFCKLMMGANKVYRKEDIERMSGANPGFGPNGANNYSIWLYKGGVNCHHYWTREIYASKDRTKDVDVKSPNAEILSPTKVIKESGKVPELNDPLVYKAPIDMPNQGRL